MRGKTIVLLGAGGAGRAVAFALMDLSAEALIVHDTDRPRANNLVIDLVGAYGVASAQLSSSLVDDIAKATGLVNATPMGMLGYPGIPVPVSAVSARLWVADVVYTPIETQLIAVARAKGARVLTGGGMCVHQAAEAFHLFTGLRPDAARMHRKFAAALSERDAALATVA